MAVTKTKSTPKQVKPTKTKKQQPESAEKSGVTVSVVGVDGKADGKMTLPVELFGAKVNKPLLSQAVRVYLANLRAGHASTKTRGEVEGSTRKIYKQKGTGRARHGAIRAPIFVGGGIVFGPKPRDYSLKFPKALKQKALASALTAQKDAGNIIVVSGFSDLKGKTKQTAKALFAVGASGSILLVVAKEAKLVIQGARNITNVDIVPMSDLNAYSIVSHSKVVFMKEALKSL